MWLHEPTFVIIFILCINFYLLDENQRLATRKKKTERLPCRSNKLCGETWTEYVTSRSVSETNLTGNRNKKPSVVPDLRCVTSVIQKFVRDRRMTHTRTVARDVMDLCIESGSIDVDRNDPKQLQAALRSVQRFLKRKGYR